MQSNPGWWKVSHYPDAELSLWINCGMGNKYARTDTGARRTAKIEEVSDPFETPRRDPTKGTGRGGGGWQGTTPTIKLIQSLLALGHAPQSIIAALVRVHA